MGSMRKRHFLRTSYQKTGIAGCVFFAAGFMLLSASRYFQGFSDWYHACVYQKLVGIIGKLFGFFPFSIAEIGMYGLFFLVIIWRVRLFKKPDAWKRWGSKVFLAGSVLFFLYAACCGVNYYNTSFVEAQKIELTDYPPEDLKEVCFWLTGKANEKGSQVMRDDTQAMCLGPKGETSMQTRLRIQVQAREEMEHLGEKVECLSGYYPQPKGLLLPQFLAFQGLSGIYAPFTAEANYNSSMAAYNLPFAMCHELAHFRGFMQEKEANYIAFLACIQAESVQFQYSGYMLGWTNCMNALYRMDYDAWEEVRKGVSPQCEIDLEKNSEYWDRYDGVVAEASNEVNNRYLKANGQEEGVKSYDRMVDLIVAGFQQGSY